MTAGADKLTFKLLLSREAPDRAVRFEEIDHGLLPFGKC